MFYETHPDTNLTVLDYFVKKSRMQCRLQAISNLLENGQLSLRLDTHGGRYVEGSTCLNLRGFERNATEQFVAIDPIQNYGILSEPASLLLQFGTFVRRSMQRIFKSENSRV